MLAFALSIGVYCFWMFLGAGLLSALRFGRHAVRNLLLAPGIGAAATLLPVFWLNRAGFPVRSLARPLTVALLIAAGVLWKFSVGRVRWRVYLPFAALLALAAVLTLRPMFWFGFNWISYGNGDMGNYVLSAERLFDHGFFDRPSVAEFVSGRDASDYYWFFHVYLGVRCGVDLLLAWLHGICGAGKTGLELFMPLIGAFYLSLISAASGFAYRFASSRKSALLTCLLLTCSALTTLGALYQLIAQVFGLSLLAAGCAILMRPLDRLPRQRLAAYATLGAVTLAALVISYPEVLPFLAAPGGVFAIWRIAASRKWGAIAAAYATMLALVLLLITNYARPMATFMLRQLVSGVVRADVIFPYYLVPSGLANFWGFLPINKAGSDPWLSMLIATGGILLILATAAVAVQLTRGDTCALVAAVMLAVGARLFATHSDFGLFKLAMFIQPFLLAAMAGAWVRIARNVPQCYGVAVLFALGGVYSQQIYEQRSAGNLGGAGGGLVEVPGISTSASVEMLLGNRPRKADAWIVSDANTTSAAKIQADLMRGYPIVFPSVDMFSNIVEMEPHTRVRETLRKWGIDAGDTAASWYAKELVAGRRQTYASESFSVPQNQEDRFFAPTLERRSDSAGNRFDLITGRDYSVLNRLENRASGPMTIFNAAAIHNHLVFIASQRGGRGDDPILSRPSLHSVEPDVSFARSVMAGFGTYALFEIWNPEPAGYLVVSFSDSYMDNGDNSLPAAIAYGSEAAPLGMAGRGSARILVPLQPREIDGRFYLALDMQTDATRFKRHLSGLMRLYGRDVPTDPRQLVGFARDISYISVAQFESLTAPASISKFPADLENPALEYSGIYEDGWVAEDSFVKLIQRGPGALRIAGMIPISTVRVRVSMDDVTVFESEVKPGSFDWNIDVRVRPGPHKIRIQFQKSQALSIRDPRPASALLTYVGFTRF